MPTNKPSEEKQTNLAQIKQAITNAKNRYFHFLRTMSEQKIGFLTPFRHGQGGVTRARDFAQLIQKCIEPEDALAEIERFLVRHPQKNKHSFSTYLLNHLAALNLSLKAHLNLQTLLNKFKKTSFYDSKTVNNVLSAAEGVGQPTTPAPEPKKELRPLEEDKTIPPDLLDYIRYIGEGRGRAPLNKREAATRRPETLKKFLLCVAHGDQTKAEALLENKNSNHYKQKKKSRVAFRSSDLY